MAGREGFSHTKSLLRKFKYTNLEKYYITTITITYSIFSNTTSFEYSAAIMSDYKF